MADFSSEKIDEIFTQLHNSVDKSNKNNQNFRIEESLSENNSIVVKGLSALIVKAVQMRASDIHIEPWKKQTKIRFRIDGILQEIEKFDISLHTTFISRLKIISKLDITEHRTPQDGKFKFKIKDKMIDFRVSIVPLITGEKAVIRILNRETINFELENLGFSELEYQKIIKLISHQNGIILSSGPTGSGKTSLIYAIIKRLNTSKVNISTVEDPVEYEIEGINQVQYSNDDKRDFSKILKAYLRQDPDIIMIGEIRDLETAQVAVKAALTGHLVLSTIHTNDAVSGIFRLLNIGIEPYMISAAVNGIIAQRLVRKLCSKCKEIDGDKKRKLKLLSKDEASFKNVNFYISKGCEECNHSGYMGRIPIFQIFILDENMREMIDRKESLGAMKEYLEKKGFKSLIDIGLEKAMQGITSLDEIIRQC